MSNLLQSKNFVDSFVKPPVFLEPWLCYTQSLTKKLRELTGFASLTVIKEGLVKSDWWSQSLLDLRSQLIFQREIIMYSQQQPCWYARTIIPQSTYEAEASLFARLEKETLGSLIFNNPAVKRIEIIAYPIKDSAIEYYWIDPLYRSIEHWARLSHFAVNGHAFYLSEIFLPGLENCLRGKVDAF